MFVNVFFFFGRNNRIIRFERTTDVTSRGGTRKGGGFRWFEKKNNEIRPPKKQKRIINTVSSDGKTMIITRIENEKKTERVWSVLLAPPPPRCSSGARRGRGVKPRFWRRARGDGRKRQTNNYIYIIDTRRPTWSRGRVERFKLRSV